MQTIIQPISPAEFTSTLITGRRIEGVDYAAYFKPLMEQAKNFAIGPYCWFIPDNTVMRIVAASENMHQLTPYMQHDWVGKDPSFLAGNIHPDDRFYVLSAITQGAMISEKEGASKIRVNIYGRMLDASRHYRWTLIQFPFHYFNREGRIESTCFMMTDISHLQTGGEVFQKPTMTIIDETNNHSRYFTLSPDAKSIEPINVPHITKREQEIVRLMVKGMNTPLMVKALNISYSTVENHKRNLRQKTNTKTSAELVHYLMANNLL